MLMPFLLAIVMSGSSRYEQVDMIELNHHYSRERHAYDQVIVWEWDPEYRRHNVRAWFLVKMMHEYPTKMPSGKWRWQNNKHAVESRVFIETITGEHGELDPERKNARIFPDKLRNPIRSILEK